MTTLSRQITHKDYSDYSGKPKLEPQDFTRIHDADLAKLTSRRKQCVNGLMQRVTDYWTKYMESKIVSASVMGDGFVRIDWEHDFDGEIGHYHLPLETLFAGVAPPASPKTTLDLLLEIEGLSNNTYRCDVCEASKLPMIRERVRSVLSALLGTKFLRNPTYPPTT